jgi:hypothetical protein
MEKLLKILAITLGSSLVIGETIRSWGQGRPLPFVLDDFLIGGGLIAGALWFRADDLKRRAAFAAAWAATVGGLYGSFFGKLLEPAGDFHSNIPGGWLTWLIGLAYVEAIFGTVATIAMKPRGVSG